ncbi:MAG TPA: acetyl-CoA carboxylase, carboxyltransferase subunit beta [Candidatus Ratteibacteria bacterium]|jgi:acetyl-CoA carboxylase carboxyl transferase subunit beta|uniref:Acetyl-coenzyme A carboxylase carboxyl transferase subunit beta n=1 Tax=candidate division TA06 bacterium ADurb.Bin131 TaxID=1852827 RepID=A0A1V6CC40_UNCT6|nr:MAG: Acetyl-coenzyme A carboxylase carboxyl transferase subunit beta [candidate division TA06 bacterium ADurb.Bin131]HOC02222.1 acetyl-CoA carboxylase, carboxyltransferase subunit beta [bacterium]HRS06477.1 acetyl-CoA carboxylase, carboxyltransferase subunit beta [Candidatus Ratteibacteria bacterium]HON05253.1 acetyl-CoA carboxylase, carboxyltransferase subunit beta [bacterium]HQL64441.1 acetyl-CoA carboxylase, carboxyltransferase subunit beta [bacterium]
MIFKHRKKYIPIKPKEAPDVKKDLWQKCPECGKLIYEGKLKENLKICPNCEYHFRLTTKEWIDIIADPGSFEELDANIFSADPLGFKGPKTYSEKLDEEIKKTGLNEALSYGRAIIGKCPAVLSILDSNFIMGSMGSVVGEKFVRACELAMLEKKPIVSVSGGGGGARMYEGVFSLMQMVKTSQVVGKMKQSKTLYVSILTDPTMGGVAASFAFLGDILLAEPKALIGFAGPRVIEQTIKQKLPPGFQKSEFLFEHGMLDAVVSRNQLKATLIKILSIFASSQ